MSTLPAGFRLRITPLELGDLWRAAGRGGSTGREDIAHACCDKELWLSRRSVAATKACATLQALISSIRPEKKKKKSEPPI